MAGALRCRPDLRYILVYKFWPLHLRWFLMVEFLGQETDIREVIYKVFWGSFECKQLS